MKTLLIALLFPIITFSQDDSTSPRTKLEKNAIKIGTIIKKNYSEVYEFTTKGMGIMASYGLGGNLNLTCKALTIKDVASGIITKGLYLSTYSTDAKSTYTGYIDAEEISGLLKFLEFLVANEDNEEEEGTEYLYTCNDVQFASFNSKEKNKLQWNYLVRVDRYRSYSRVNLGIKNIEELLQALKTNSNKFD